MNIPCPNCTRRTECLRDRHCNRPLTMVAALRELKAACEAMQAAITRVREAAAQVEAVQVIEKGQRT